MLKFPFNDLHSFKDYVVFVQLCSPDSYPPVEGLSSDDQWTLDLAFKGLREGLALSAKEKGDLPVFDDCRRLVAEAHECYRAGKKREGFATLEEVCKRLAEVPSE